MAECEGFICPLCMRDFRGVLQLEQHFQEDHSETTQSRFRSNLKNFLGKLKRKNVEEGDDIVDEGAAAASGGGGGVVTNISGFDWEPQPFGTSRDLMRVFRRERDVIITGLAAETNRLIIRVEKLFRALQDTTVRTSNARKELEQSVVTWKPDKEEKRCRYCGRGFNLRRRKHHCRLCGGIICNQCSHYMTLSETYPVLCDCPDFHSLAPPVKTSVLSLKRKKSRRKQQPAEAEAEADDDEKSSELRMCLTCHHLIHRRLHQLEKLEKPLLTALYEKMQLMIRDADNRKPVYLLMAEPLIAGDHGHTLHEAMKKRQELIKIYEGIDTISKDILSLVSDIAADPSAPTQRMYKLCRGIRTYASTYLQDNLLTLPSLPSPQQLAEIRDRKEREAEERLRVIKEQREFQRQSELLTRDSLPQHRLISSGRHYEETGDERGFERGVTAPYNIDTSSSNAQGEKKKRFEKLKNFSNKVIPKVSFKREGGGMGEEATVRVGRSGSGWMGAAREFSVDSQDDPFSLQRKQLISYIEQAMLAGRTDEVAALQQSLHDIENQMTEDEPGLYGFEPQQSI